MKRYLLNGFPCSLVPQGNKAIVEEVSPETIKSHLEKVSIVSAIGHADTAHILSSLLGSEIVQNRVSVSIKPEDWLYIAAYTGPRLPEGCRKLPEGASFRFFLIRFQPEENICHEHDDTDDEVGALLSNALHEMSILKTRIKKLEGMSVQEFALMKAEQHVEAEKVASCCVESGSDGYRMIKKSWL